MKKLKVEGKSVYRGYVGEDGKEGFRTFAPYSIKFAKEVEKEYVRTGVHKPNLFNASFIHKGTDKVEPYGYKRDIIFGSGHYGQTAIARDIANVKKRRG